MPLPPPQEAPSRSPQSQQLQNRISTHPPTPECLTPVAGGNRALSKCGSGLQRDFRRPEVIFSHFCTFLELLQRQPGWEVIQTLTQRGQGFYSKEHTISVCRLS